MRHIIVTLDRKPNCYGRAFARHLLRKKSRETNDINDEKLLKMLKELSAKTIVEGTTLFKDWDVPNPLQWKPSLDPESNEPFMPIPFEQAIKEGLFDKNIPILTGCTSEEGLVFSTPFLKSPRRWRMLFENWYHWAPLLFFNRYLPTFHFSNLLYMYFPNCYFSYDKIQLFFLFPVGKLT